MSFRFHTKTTEYYNFNKMHLYFPLQNEKSDCSTVRNRGTMGVSQVMQSNLGGPPKSNLWNSMGLFSAWNIYFPKYLIYMYHF